MISAPCDMCGETVVGEDLDAYGRAAVVHVRAAHPDLPYGDMAVRNFFEGEARATGGTERLDAIGAVEIHPVTEDRIDDWLDFFDHHAMVGTPQNSSCYCLEPHEMSWTAPAPPPRHWRERRTEMVARLRAGTTFGYLAYVDGRPAGWVNASRRADYSLFRRGDEADAATVALSCFAVAPPYRGHGLAGRLLDRVVADAAGRGAEGVEAYPANPSAEIEPMGFRGPRPMYESAGFTEIKVRAFDTVVRRPV
jgi:GNAT superfamily N-acetyltransferase